MKRGTIPSCLALALIVLTSTAAGAPPVRTPVDLVIRGDDGMTQNFRLALENAVATSPDFEIAKRKTAQTVVFEIPDHLFWCSTGDRTVFQRVVVITDSDSRYLGTSVGTCSAGQMAECASEVLRETRLLLRSRSGHR